MPRGFDENEKEEIYAQLLEHGKQLFSLYGLKKTSIAELSKAAGIAQGSFYSFYSSKEDLYFAILEKEEEAIKEELAHFSPKRKADPMEAIKQLLFQTLKRVEGNPLFSQMLQEDNLQALRRKLPKERLEAHFKKDADTLTVFTNLWKEAGIEVDIQEDVLTGLFRSLFLMTLHKKEIGEAIYDETMRLMIDLIISGITAKEGNHGDY
ncbi:TetR/AcrR family transcriptional regulator [Sediminibacillus halophilus]|uniref:DNA-binding transcriptional regulator, AcrR family n=1 Tax=Sediminibacillus halophilus TaxID=482461 RepID=A0A1G9NF34_9BACI|nr:TetR/AcrR family transcriptional regulator [Sediminibacillus halophilus]SDL85049.1 DNA-binding transcriptional regulator, AcrR family [Sediminibacillus halophilus]